MADTSTALISLVTRDHPASEVYVTGTFDNWAKTERLEQTGTRFQKTVSLPNSEDKILYKVRLVTKPAYAACRIRRIHH